MSALAQRLDHALVALSRGNRRRLLELVRDEPAAVEEMATQFGMSTQAVSQDISMLHLAEYEEQYDDLGAAYDQKLLDAAHIQADSRVLDVGCGAGVSTRKAAKVAVLGAVVGVDVAPALLKRARDRSRAEGLANTSFVQADVQVHAFEAGSFDVAISRFGAMYFHDPAAAFANIASALRPGGRLAMVSWQELEGNEWMSAVRDALAVGRELPPLATGTAGAFGLADPEAVRAILTGAGFEDVRVDDVREPVSFGPDADQAFNFVSTLAFAKDALAGLQGRDRSAGLARLREVLEAHAGDDGVWFASSAWITTARRP